MSVNGWLFDAYPLRDKMVFWIKDANDHIVRLEEYWTPSIYVGSDNKSNLETLRNNQAVKHYIKSSNYVSRRERIRDHDESMVLEVTLADSSKVMSLANAIEDIDVHDKFRLYNVDILPPQAYFYQHDIFPLAKCKIDVQKDGKLRWHLDDDVRFTNYRLPEFKVVHRCYAKTTG